jgi:hypothetical protein
MSTRNRLNLTSSGGQTLHLSQLDSGAELNASLNLLLTVPALKVVSGDDTVNNVANSINSNAANILQEASDRASADTTLQSNIDTEASARATAITSEATTRSTADSTLQTNINAEATAREAADDTLQGNINAEGVARAGADNVLTTKINTEISDRETAVSAEATSRTAADTTLQANIDSEAATRAAAVTSLQSDITTEKNRVNAILNLSQTELDTFKEISDAYQAADSNLQSLITSLTSDFNALKLVVDTLATNTGGGGGSSA